MKKLLTAALLLSLWTGQSVAAQSLPSQCVDLGKTKLTKVLQGVDQAKWGWIISVRTRYDIGAARCYIAIEGYANTGYMFINLYDGQTDETLATASMIHHKDGSYDSWDGSITGEGHYRGLSKQNIKTQADFEAYMHDKYTAAIDYINSKITEKR